MYSLRYSCVFTVRLLASVLPSLASSTLHIAACPCKGAVYEALQRALSRRSDYTPHTYVGEVAAPTGR
jgi:hypothetical protein